VNQSFYLLLFLGVELFELAQNLMELFVLTDLLGFFLELKLLHVLEDDFIPGDDILKIPDKLFDGLFGGLYLLK
jgi:hypothetical protein